MTEPRESRTEPTTVTGERRAYETPPYDDRRTGVVFIVAVIFFSGFFIGRSASGNFRGGYHHQPGMMWPSQTGPYDQWPGMMGPGGMMGPYGPWPSQQPTTTTGPTTPRP